jgi:hypothetical protein
MKVVVTPPLALVMASVSIGLCSLSCATRSWALLTTTSAQSESGFSTDIVSVDGKPPTRENLGVEPGRHYVEAVGTSRRVGVNAPAGTKAAVLGVGLVSPLVGAGIALANWADATHSTRMKACFIARPGRTYEVRTYVEGEAWHIEVVDQATTYDVKSPCKKPGDTPGAKPPAKPGT